MHAESLVNVRPVTIRLDDEYYNNDNQERRDKADGYRLGCLLHILHDVKRESIELGIGHAFITIAAGKLVFFSLEEQP